MIAVVCMHRLGNCSNRNKNNKWSFAFYSFWVLERDRQREKDKKTFNNCTQIDESVDTNVDIGVLWH